MSERLSLFCEAIVLLAVTLALALSLHQSVVWLLVPVLWLSLTKRDPDSYGLVWNGPGDLRLHGINLLCFAGYLAGHYAFGRYVLGQQFVLRLPEEPLWLLTNQLLAIGLPEECFFRGYLQSQLDRVWPPRWRLLGATVGPALVLTAVLFGACHVLHGGPARLVTALPGLWYGWQRAYSGSVVVPALYHAGSNFLMATMLNSLN